MKRHTEAPARRSFAETIAARGERAERAEREEEHAAETGRLPKNPHRRTHVLPQEDSQIWIMIMNPKSRFPIF